MCREIQQCWEVLQERLQHQLIVGQSHRVVQLFIEADWCLEQAMIMQMPLAFLGGPYGLSAASLAAWLSNLKNGTSGQIVTVQMPLAFLGGPYGASAASLAAMGAYGGTPPGLGSSGSGSSPQISRAPAGSPYNGLQVPHCSR